MDRDMDKDTSMGLVRLPPGGPPGTLTPAHFCPLLQPLAPSALTGSCAFPSTHILTRVLQRQPRHTLEWWLGGDTEDKDGGLGLSSAGEGVTAPEAWEDTCAHAEKTHEAHMTHVQTDTHNHGHRHGTHVIVYIKTHACKLMSREP